MSNVYAILTTMHDSCCAKSMLLIKLLTCSRIYKYDIMSSHVHGRCMKNII